MFDAQRLLGQLMGGGMSRSAGDRIGHAVGGTGLSSGDSPLGNLLGSLTGGGQGGASGGSLGGMTDKVGGMFGKAGDSVRSGNPLALGSLGAIAGAVLGGGGGALRGALGGGALALLGTLAYQALKPDTPRDPRQVGEQAPLGLREPQTLQEQEEVQHTALLAVRAMVNAAKADGVIDPDEYNRILGQLREAGVDDEARAFAEAEMRRPLDLDALVRDVRTPEQAAEIYAASLLAIEVDTDAERQYLRTLASRTGLGHDVVQRLHQMLGAPL